MEKQNYEIQNEKIRLDFEQLKRSSPERFTNRLNLSWSNWGFGIEKLSDSLERLSKAGVGYIELHGNHYGPDLGYQHEETLEVLSRHHIKTSGICGMFSADNDLSSNRALSRQSAVDYLKREIEFISKMGGEYILVVPGAVGRPEAYDDCEFERSVETLCIVADLFFQNGIKAAIEPIRSAEVSFIHTIADARRYIDAINHQGIRHINGDVYHMQSEERHIGQAILEAGESLVNLHMADSNRCALGEGSLDLDTVIRALYLIGHNRPGRFVTPEPLGPGASPYPAMYGRPDPERLDRLVFDTISYFRKREDALLS